MKHYKVLFCDLDGTLIKTKSGKTFPKGVWDMELKFNVLDAIKRMKPEYVFIVSNQGGIEKGFVEAGPFFDKIRYVRACVQTYCDINSMRIDYNYCTSNDTNNKDRKPNVGMLECYNDSFWNNGRYSKEDILMIGDASGKEGQFSDTDKKTAENFGIDYMNVDNFVNKIEVERAEEIEKELFELIKEINPNCKYNQSYDPPVRVRIDDCFKTHYSTHKLLQEKIENHFKTKIVIYREDFVSNIVWAILDKEKAIYIK